jgi:hypothetical protein
MQLLGPLRPYDATEGLNLPNFHKLDSAPYVGKLSYKFDFYSTKYVFYLGRGVGGIKAL